MSAAIGIISGLAFVGGGWALAAYLVRKAYGQPLTEALDDTCRDFAHADDIRCANAMRELYGIAASGCECGPPHHGRSE